MRLIIHLTPHAASSKIEGWAQNAEDQKILRVKVTAVPEDNKANIAMITLLSKTFRIPKTQIFLIRGAKSRIKEVDIAEPFDKLIKSQDLSLPRGETL